MHDGQAVFPSREASLAKKGPEADSYLLFRKAMEVYAKIGDRCWSEITPFLHIRKLNKNEHFSKVGESIRELGFVIEGILRIYALTENGEELNKNLFTENDFFAASVNPETVSTTYIQAIAPTRIVVLPYLKFLELSRRYPLLENFHLKVTISYLMRKEEKEILFRSMEGMERYRYLVDRYPGIDRRIPLYHIAGYLGITPTQLSRIRKLIKNDASQHM